MNQLALLFVKKHWKLILVIVSAPIVVIASYTKGYYVGKNQCEVRIAEAVSEEMKKREEKLEKLRSEMRQTQDRIIIDRKKNKIDDKRDSCILSNDPFSVDCVGEEND